MKQTWFTRTLGAALLTVGLGAVVACSGSSATGPTADQEAVVSQALAGGTVSADGAGAAGPGRPGGPPAEAIAACASLADDAACSFTGPRGSASGTCRTLRDGVRACAPADLQRGGRPSGPPPQAVQACAGSTAGASCSFEGRSGTVSGTCSLPPEGREGALACKPAGPPPNR